MNDVYTEYLKSVIRFMEAQLEQKNRRIDMMIDYVFDEVSVPVIRKLMQIAYLSPEVDDEDHN